MYQNMYRNNLNIGRANPGYFLYGQMNIKQLMPQNVLQTQMQSDSNGFNRLNV